MNNFLKIKIYILKQKIFFKKSLQEYHVIKIDSLESCTVKELNWKS